MSPQETVLAVFARVRAGDLSVAELYADNAELADTRDGSVHTGRDAIRAFYEKVLRVDRPQPQVVGLYVSLPMVVGVLQVDRPGGDVARVADVFEVSDGAIQRMRICFADESGALQTAGRA